MTVKVSLLRAMPLVVVMFEPLVIASGELMTIFTAFAPVTPSESVAITVSYQIAGAVDESI